MFFGKRLLCVLWACALCGLGCGDEGGGLPPDGGVTPSDLTLPWDQSVPPDPTDLAPPDLTGLDTPDADLAGADSAGDLEGQDIPGPDGEEDGAGDLSMEGDGPALSDMAGPDGPGEADGSAGMDLLGPGTDRAGHDVRPADGEVPNQPPVAEAGDDREVAVGEGTILDGRASFDPDGAIGGGDWDFGDGEGAEGLVATHTYLSPGTYTATLTVWDDLGLETTDTLTVTVTPQAYAWKILIYMDADNDLEGAYFHDMNELEAGGSDDNVAVLVQADRIRGYSRADGNWTDARRYRIVADQDPDVIASEMMEELGEVDMGDPQTLIDFVAWADALWPSQRTAIVIWNHGDSWTKDTKEFAIDDTSGNSISVADGEYAFALEEITAILGGPVDLMAFDACLMASWEVLTVEAPYVLFHHASQATVGMNGLDYTATLRALRQDPAMDGLALGDEFARGASELGEYTQSVSDLSRLPRLNRAVDALALAVMDLDNPVAALRRAVNDSITFDRQWFGYYQDIPDLARALREGGHGQAVNEAANEVSDALKEVVRFNYALRPYAEAGGLHICATDDRDYIDLYATSPGAVWAQETAWDDLLMLMR